MSSAAAWGRRGSMRVRQFLMAVARRALLDPIRDGRPRDRGWPEGLRTVVGIAAGACVLAAALAVGSPLLRSGTSLIYVDAQQAVLPRPSVWPLLVLILVLLSLFQTAALHAPWWLRTLATLTSVGTVLLWGLIGAVQASGLARLSPLLPLLVVVGLVVLVILRSHRSFAWWEFPVVLALLGLGVGVGPLLSGLVATGQALGYDAVPLLVVTSVQDVALLAVPVMIAAGVSVAELTVGLTVQAGAQAARLGSRRSAYLILAAVGLLRLLAVVRQSVNWDPVADGWPVVLTTLAAALLLGLVVLGVIGVGGRPAAGTAAELPEQTNRLALPVGAALTALLLVATVFSVIRNLITPLGLGPAGPAHVLAASTLASGSRVLLGVLLLGLAVLRARRGHVREALVFGCTGVVLLAVAARFLTGYRYPVGLDPDVLNLIAAVVAFALAITSLIRRRLTPRRSIQLATALTLSSLFAFRDVLADPLGVLVGVSGIALVVFGIFWDLLTGSAWANREGRRFAVPSRVQLVMAKSLLGLLVVGYAALTRSAQQVADPDAFGDLGDLVLGTALVAAAFVAILKAAEEEPPPAAKPIAENAEKGRMSPVSSEQTAAELYDLAMANEQAARLVQDVGDVDAVRAEVRRLARRDGTRIRTGIVNGDTLAVIRADAALWGESTAVMVEKLRPEPSDGQSATVRNPALPIEESGVFSDRAELR